MKNIKDPNGIVFTSVAVLIFAAILFILTDIFVDNRIFKFVVVAGVGLGWLIYIITSLIKLKTNGLIYDERDNYIDGETSIIALRLFQILLALIAIFTYGLDDVEISISEYTLLLFFISSLMYLIINIFKKRRA